MTPLTEKKVSQPELHQQIVDHVPMRRLGTPEDLDGLVMYLCSDLSGFLPVKKFLSMADTHCGSLQVVIDC